MFSLGGEIEPSEKEREIVWLGNGFVVLRKALLKLPTT
jgi:hypothetical protein